MGQRLYVGNLPFSATEDSLKEVFLQVGTVESVTIITDKETGQSKGFGFLEMSTPQEASDAISRMNGSEMDGRTLKVSQAQTKVPRDNSGSGRSHNQGFRR